MSVVVCADLQGSGSFTRYGDSSDGALSFANFVRTKGSGIDVYITDIYTSPSQSDAATVASWVSQGGALLVGGHSWSYGGYSSAQDPNEFPGASRCSAVSFQGV